MGNSSPMVTNPPFPVVVLHLLLLSLISLSPNMITCGGARPLTLRDIVGLLSARAGIPDWTLSALLLRTYEPRSARGAKWVAAENEWAVTAPTVKCPPFRVSPLAQRFPAVTLELDRYGRAPAVLSLWQTRRGDADVELTYRRIAVRQNWMTGARALGCLCRRRVGRMDARRRHRLESREPVAAPRSTNRRTTVCKQFHRCCVNELK